MIQQDIVRAAGMMMEKEILGIFFSLPHLVSSFEWDESVSGYVLSVLLYVKKREWLSSFDDQKILFFYLFVTSKSSLEIISVKFNVPLYQEGFKDR